MQTIDKYLELYQQNREQIGKDAPDFLNLLRDRALTSFKQTGFPLRKEERYKYTHLEPVFDGELTFDFQPRAIYFDEADIFRCDVPMLDSTVLTVLNGFFHNPGGETLTRLDSGIIYGSLREAMVQHPDLVGQYLGKNAALNNEPFVSLYFFTFQKGSGWNGPSRSSTCCFRTGARWYSTGTSWSWNPTPWHR